MNLDDCSKQWAILMYAMAKHRHEALVDFTANLLTRALNQLAEEDLHQPIDSKKVMLEVTKEEINHVLGLISMDHKAALVTNKLMAENAHLIEDEEELKERFIAVAASVTPEVVAKHMQNLTEGKDEAEVPQQDASGSREDLS